jgi:flagellar basal-body rod protein FlgB
MASSDALFGIDATALKLREQRMTLLASNIANAATPGFKARDLDFPAAIKAAEQGDDVAREIRFRVPVQSSMDGNTVELSTEQTAFAENALGYRASLSFLQSRIATLNRALKGE